MTSVPTKAGDVLILTKSAAGSTHLVCPVSADGQQGGTADRHTVSGAAAAEEKARSLVVLEGHVYLLSQDTGEWREL